METRFIGISFCYLIEGVVVEIKHRLIRRWEGEAAVAATFCVLICQSLARKRRQTSYKTGALIQLSGAAAPSPPSRCASKASSLTLGRKHFALILFIFCLHTFVPSFCSFFQGGRCVGCAFVRHCGDMCVALGPRCVCVAVVIHVCFSLGTLCRGERGGDS